MRTIYIPIITAVVFFLLHCAPPTKPTDIPPSNLKYPNADLVFYATKVISPISPTFDGRADSFYSEPSLPHGLAISKHNGTISGTPDSVYAKAAYTITAWHHNGSDEFVLNITVVKVPAVTTQPLDAQATLGGRAVFFIAADGGAGQLTYQWYKGAAAIAGKTSAGLTIDNIAVTDTGAYWCVVADTNGMADTSDVAHCVLQAAGAPFITTHPHDTAAVAGATVILRTRAIGTDLVYQWYKNGTLVPDAAGNNLVIDNFSSADTGYYQVKVSNVYGNDLSDSAHLSILASSYSIAIDVTGSGTITFGSVSFMRDTSVSVALNASAQFDFQPAIGHQTSQVLIDGAENQPARLAGSYTFASVASNHTIAVTFAAKILTVVANVNDTAFGEIIKSPARDTFAYHDSITLIARPKSQCYFAGWSGTVPDAMKSRDTIKLFVDSSLIIEANFARIGRFPLLISILPTAAGSVSKAPDSTSYLKNTMVNVTAHSAAGYRFSHWEGASTSLDSATSLTMDTAKSLIAHFDKIICTLSVQKSPAEGGAVNIAHDSAVGYFDTISISASPAAVLGYAFKVWRKTAGAGAAFINDSSAQATTVLLRNGNATISAIFMRLDTFTLSAVCSPLSGGTIGISPNNAKYAYGDTVTVTPQAGLGYTFGNWSGDTSGNANPLKFIIRGNAGIIANFSPSGSIQTISLTTTQSLNAMIKQASGSPGAGVIIMPAEGRYDLDNLNVGGKVTIPIQRR